MPIDLRGILKLHQSHLLAGLETSRAIFENAEAKGDATEFQWRELIDDFLPTRYQATAAFVLDCEGECSDFIDVVIHDRHYCPLLFEQGGQKYIPAESVYAAFEVKQEFSKAHMEYASSKGASVRRLMRTNREIVHAGGTYEARPLFEILTGILALESMWSPSLGDPFVEAVTSTAGEHTSLSLGCCLRHGAFSANWAGDTPQITVSAADVSLMFFLMTLFTRLQRIGTVPAIELGAYSRSLRA